MRPSRGGVPFVSVSVSTVAEVPSRGTVPRRALRPVSRSRSSLVQDPQQFAELAFALLIARVRQQLGIRPHPPFERAAGRRQQRLEDRCGPPPDAG